MNTTAQTLRELVTYFREQATSQTNEAVRGILLSNHPAFRRFAELTNATYRVYFTTRAELDAWLKARSWTVVTEGALDEDSVTEWVNIAKNKYIKLTHELFDEAERLEAMTAEEWHDEWLQIRDVPPEQTDDASGGA